MDKGTGKAGASDDVDGLGRVDGDGVGAEEGGFDKDVAAAADQDAGGQSGVDGDLVDNR